MMNPIATKGSDDQSKFVGVFVVALFEAPMCC